MALSVWSHAALIRLLYWCVVVKSSLLRLPMALWWAPVLLVPESLRSLSLLFPASCHLTWFLSETLPASPQTLEAPALTNYEIITSGNWAEPNVGVTQHAVRKVCVQTWRVGGFTALQAPGCWFSDRWKIVPTSNLWSGSNGKGMETAADHTCQRSSQNPVMKVFDAAVRRSSPTMIITFYLRFLNIWLQHGCFSAVAPWCPFSD